MARLRWLLERIEAVSFALAGAALMAIMVVVGIDVTMRYIFNSPLSWAYILISEYLIAASFFFALGPTLARDQHVVVDMVYQRFPPPLKRAARLVTHFVVLPVFAIVAGLGTVRAFDRWRGGDVLAGAIPWPTWIPSAIVAFGVGLLVARLLVDIVGLLVGDADREP